MYNTGYRDEYPSCYRETYVFKHMRAASPCYFTQIYLRISPEYPFGEFHAPQTLRKVSYPQLSFEKFLKPSTITIHPVTQVLITDPLVKADKAFRRADTWAWHIQHFKE